MTSESCCSDWLNSTPAETKVELFDETALPVLVNGKIGIIN